MTIISHQSYLESFIDYEKQRILSSENFTLDRIFQLLKLLGNPEKKLKIIHVAGSKGKGSTCAMTASILARAGYKVGLYTSPHLNHYRERIRILNGAQNNTEDIFADAITSEDLFKCAQEIFPAVEEIQSQKNLGNLTFYEVYTALALYYFQKQQTDFVVLETGLGGRLDATNAADSIVCALTPISLEHTQLLGNTLAEIAEEKAAIIKSNRQKVVIAQQKEETWDVFAHRCRKFNIVPSYMVADAQAEAEERYNDYQIVSIQTKRNFYQHLRLSLVGDHQLLNAKVAIGVIEELQNLGYAIDDSAIWKGLANVFWPGRFEIVNKTPCIILDGAHNKDSMEALANTFKQIFGDKKATVIIGVSEDKDKKSICQELNQIADKVIATKADHPRGSSWTNAELESYFTGNNFFLAENVSQALELAKQETAPDGFIIITGSLFVISEARKICIN